MDADRACRLCGLDIGDHPFELRLGQGTLRFCCEGCLGIYQMLHEGELAAVDEDPSNPKEN